MHLVASQSVPHGEPCWSSSRTLGSQVWRSTRRQVQYSYVAQGQPSCWARCPCVVIPLGDPTCVFFHGTAPPPWWVRVFPGRTLCLLCCVAISPQAGWVYLRDSRMWYCPWPVHTCNLHMIPPYAGCGSVVFPPTWGTLSQCYSTRWAEQQCGYLCLNPVLSSIPTGVGGLAGFCRALDIGQRYTNLIQNTLSAEPAWPLEILRNNDHMNNRRRRRKHRGRRAGIRNRLRKRAHSPPLPSILLANVQSLENKMDDLRARISFQRDIRYCNIFCLTETWLSPTVPDTAVTPSDNFSVLRMDRSAEAGKNKGGGVCFFINKKWCDPRNISILSRSCSPHLEHLSIICRPFYLPREFTSILVSAVYIPPQADTSVALSNLHDEISGYINKHPDAACIIAGDFNKANLKKVLPNFHQHISCPTRGLNTLDHCYTPLNNAYKAHSLPAFGKSDHVAIFLTPEYKQRIARKPPVEREVTRWSSHSEAMLQASLDDVDWDMFRASSSDVSEFTDVAVSFVNTLTEQATETVTIRTFTNQKPWVDRSIRDAVNHRTAAYNAGLLSGNMSEYKTSCYALRRAIRAAKRRYSEKIESHF